MYGTDVDLDETLRHDIDLNAAQNGLFNGDDVIKVDGTEVSYSYSDTGAWPLIIVIISFYIIY